MSGNPGGGGGGSGGPGGGGTPIATGPLENPCDLRFKTVLASVDQSVLPSLVVGQVLAVSLESNGTTVFLATKDSSGAFVGAIASHVPILMGCISQGYSYAATIADITGAAVTVEVSRS